MPCFIAEFRNLFEKAEDSAPFRHKVQVEIYPGSGSDSRLNLASDPEEFYAFGADISRVQLPSILALSDVELSLKVKVKHDEHSGNS
jgi:hypothetical protein